MRSRTAILINGNDAAAPRTITLLLKSNVSEYEQDFVLTETAPNSGSFTGPTESQVLSVPRLPSRDPSRMDTVAVNFVTTTFGFIGPQTLYETGLDTNVFETEHATLSVVVAQAPTNNVVDTLTVTLASDVASKAGAGSIFHPTSI